MQIFNVLKEKACTSSLTAKTKKECILELSRGIVSADRNLKLEDVLSSLEEREEKGSTAFENGIAIPHARLKHTAFTLGIAVSKRGIDFGSIDGKKTTLFFIIIGPDEKPEEYLKLLAQISRMAKNKKACREIRNSSTPLALKEAFLLNISGASATAHETKKLTNPKLFTIILYEKQYLDDITQLLLEHGIRGASVTDSTGIRDVLSKVPLFATFLNFLGERKEVSKTIMTIIDKSDIPPLVEGIEDIMGDLNTHSGAMVFALDVSYFKGSLEVV